jgi:hypothetical protein
MEDVLLGLQSEEHQAHCAGCLLGGAHGKAPRT